MFLKDIFSSSETMLYMIDLLYMTLGYVFHVFKQFSKEQVAIGRQIMGVI